MKKKKILICPKCVINKSGVSKLIIKNSFLICAKCKEYYPIYKGFPVMLTKNNDFYHLKKALSPAKYRVYEYGD